MCNWSAWKKAGGEWGNVTGNTRLTSISSCGDGPSVRSLRSPWRRHGYRESYPFDFTHKFLTSNVVSVWIQKQGDRIRWGGVRQATGQIVHLRLDCQHLYCFYFILFFYSDIDTFTAFFLVSCSIMEIFGVHFRSYWTLIEPSANTEATNATT